MGPDERVELLQRRPRLEPSSGGRHTLVAKCIGMASLVLRHTGGQRLDAIALRICGVLAPGSGCTFLVSRALALPVDHILVTAGFKLPGASSIAPSSSLGSTGSGKSYESIRFLFLV